MDKPISLNDTFSYEFSFSQDDVEYFAKASGDYNPIHLDEEYAKSTIFKRRIIHGFLGGSIFSKVFGILFPGEGTIYLMQNMKFMKPMFTDERYKANFKVIEIISDKNRAIINTQIFDMSDNIIISGEALIQNSRIGK